MPTFTVELDDEETAVLVELMRACGLSNPNTALRAALFTQCRLSDIPMPPGCFDVGKRPAKVSA